MIISIRLGCLIMAVVLMTTRSTTFAFVVFVPPPSSLLSMLIHQHCRPVQPVTLRMGSTHHEEQVARFVGDGDGVGYSIEQVSSRDRALDIWVFRNWSPPLADYLAQNPEYASNPEEALRRLTPFHNDQGRKIVLSGGEFVHFVACRTRGENREQQQQQQQQQEGDRGVDISQRTRGVVAHVDVHRKESAPSSGQTMEVDATDGDVILEMKNLLVDENYRRQGIARALVEAVQKHAAQQCDNTATSATVYLHVELDNDAAIPLYLSLGFEFDAKEESRMNWTTTC